ncbi:MAG: ribonuclease HII [Pseudomonadota bacterium]
MTPVRKSEPSFDLESAVLARGLRRVSGIDEAGRGPLAGPVVAAAVVLDPNQIPSGLADSKALSAKRRCDVFARLKACAEVSIGLASVEEIDRLNILHATHLAMVRAVLGLVAVPSFALVDGNSLPKTLPCPAQAVVKGDARSLSVAAASIAAKCTRDAIMVDLAQQHPGYGWEQNMGYPTKAHRAALCRLGVTPHHRRSFAPVHNMLYQEKS